MTRAAALLLLASCATSTTAQAVDPRARTGLRLVFADEFDRPGKPDPAVWTYELGYHRNHEKQFYTDRPENVRVEGGHLVIEARKEAHEGFDYTSASITTEGRRAWTYGRIEIRAKIPAGRGLWPALWTLGTNRRTVGWPLCGEIDIVENVGFEPDLIHTTVHTEAYNHVKRTHRSATVPLPNAAADFHVYAVEWTRDGIDFFLDDRKVFTFARESGGEPVWPFDHPQYLLLNVAVGGDWGGQKGIDDSVFPQKLLVDYVRVYQR